MNTFPRSWIELNSTALYHNVMHLKQAAGQADLAVVLKSNAYGHGAYPIASLLNTHKDVAFFCTAGLSEALFLRKQGITKPLIALSYLDGGYDEAIFHGIHCAIYTYTDALALSAAALRIGKPAYVHIKVDTGMSRLGIMPEDTLSFIKALQKVPQVIIYGIFTHLCDTSNNDQSFSYHQLNRFDTLLSTLEQAGISIPCVHAQSSSGLCVEPKKNYTMIRAGASVYGLWKSEEHKNLVFKQCPYLDLQPVMTWKTRIVQIKAISQGSYVGYDKTYHVACPMKIAIVPIGYWEGYPRKLSNAGTVLIHTIPAPVIGIVSMNLTIIDITHIPHASLGDEVTLLGPAPITAAQCARTAGIITNEMVTCINPELPRLIL